MFANDTISRNAAGNPGYPAPPAATSDGGALIQNGGAVSMTQVTIADNSEIDVFNCCYNIASTGDMTISDSALDATCNAGVIDGGHNVALAGQGCPGLQAEALGGSPEFDLGPLQDNGGATQTMLPAAGSALIGEVPRTGAGCLPTDQRGIVRPQGSACDAGAVERIATSVRLRPAPVKFGRLDVGRVQRKTVKLTVTSAEGVITLGKARVTGRNSGSFRVVANRCRYEGLEVSQSCTVVVSFRPRKPGRQTAKVTIAGAPVAIALVGTGTG
jgi:hypothetical protein